MTAERRSLTTLIELGTECRSEFEQCSMVFSGRSALNDRSLRGLNPTLFDRLPYRTHLRSFTMVNAGIYKPLT